LKQDSATYMTLF